MVVHPETFASALRTEFFLLSSLHRVLLLLMFVFNQIQSTTLPSGSEKKPAATVG